MAAQLPRDAAPLSLRVQVERRGVLLLATALVFITSGLLGGRPVLLAWGSVPLLFVVAAWARAVVSTMGRTGRPLAIACGSPVGPRKIHAVGDDLTLPVTLGTRLGRAIRAGRLTLVASGALELLDDVPPLDTAPDGEARATARLRPIQAGTWFIHGAHVRLPLGDRLVSVVGYLPIEARFKVLPRSAFRSSRATLPVRRSAARASARDSLGAARSLVRGLGTDLRELREHVPGDPFKHIAWKASARTGKLVVKEFESSVTQSCYLLLDTGPSMRWGVRGQTLLDRATDVAFAWAQELARGGVRFGLLCYDADVWAHVHAADGRRALVAVADHLLEAHTSMREPVTAATDADVIAAVGTYLHRQWGRDFRADNGPSSGRAPIEALWDRDAMSAWVGAVLPELGGAVPRLHGDAHLASDPQMRALRQLCRVQGIELPLRATWGDGEREAGLSRALEQVLTSPGGPHTVVVITDLLGIDDAGPVTRQLQALARRKHDVTFLLPPPRSLGQSLDLRSRVAGAEEARQSLERETVQARLRASGARVSLHGPLR
ncbi:MAG: hypothetical protein AMXMBFR64_46660 [Myxococcales bacterium]